MVDMSFEKIEHPACRAARTIKALHEDNLKMIADGYIFMRDGVDVNETIVQACKEQIAQCDAIIERARTLDPRDWSPPAMETTATPAGAVVPTIPNEPEIGNYDHEKNSWPNRLHDDGRAPADD